MPRKKKDPKPAATADSPLTSALDAIQAKYGGEAARRLGSASDFKHDVISTGSMGLDDAIGVGGLPRGRIVEVYGPESSGKTTLCLHVIAEAQRLGLPAAFVDAEHALDPVYAEAIGVNTDDLLISQPDYGEMALGVVDMVVRTGGFGVVVVDSVAALTPKAELDGEIEDQSMALQARMMSKVMRRLTAATSKNGTLVLFINQTRSKVGKFFGSPTTTSGGNALKFYSSVRLEVRRISAVKSGEQTVAMKTKVKVVKNKVARPFQEAEFDIAFGVGIDQAAEVIDAAVIAGVMDKKGSFYAYKGENVAQGRANAITYLREHPKIMEAIRRKVRKVGV